MEVAEAPLWKAVNRCRLLFYARDLLLAATYRFDFAFQGNASAASPGEPQVYQQLAGALARNVAKPPRSQSESAKQNAR